jgi:hypothetical protein
MKVVVLKFSDSWCTDGAGYLYAKIRSCRHEGKSAAMDDIKLKPQLCSEPVMFGCKVCSVLIGTPIEWCREQGFERVLSPAAEAEG